MKQGDGGGSYTGWSWMGEKNKKKKKKPNLIDEYAKHAANTKFNEDDDIRTTKRRSSSRRSDMAKKYSKSVLKTAAGRRADYKRRDTDSEASYRAKHGLYRGKYYGPDIFKGDVKAVQSWKKAGSPKDKSAFIKMYRSSSGKDEPTSASTRKKYVAPRGSRAAKRKKAVNPVLGV